MARIIDVLAGGVILVSVVAAWLTGCVPKQYLDGTIASAFIQPTPPTKASCAANGEMLSFLNNVPILQTLNQVERANLCEILKRHVYKERTQLIKRGEKGDSFFILESGTAKAVGEDGAELKSYVEKDYFGELALLGNTVRACDVFVDPESVVLSVDQASFNRLLGKLEKIMADAKIQQYGESLIDATK